MLCINCKKEIKSKRIRKYRTKYCSIKCSAIHRGKQKRGENHWNWKGGVDSRHLKKTAPRPRPEKCEVCGEYGKKRNGIVLDHNHKTKTFRGWLCSNCNTALGLLNEDPKRFDLLKEYLLNNENGKNCWKP